MEEKKINYRKKRGLKYSIEDMQALAKVKGGKCLSDQYTGIFNKLQWQCKEGHTWFMNTNSIIHKKRWCSKCHKKSAAEKRGDTIEQMQSLAKQRGGKCLSEKFVGTYGKLQWQCMEGHIWSATLYNIHKGSWCPKCKFKNNGVKLRGYLETIQKIAIERGGKCLSTEYVHSHKKLQWQCNKGHIWIASPRGIKGGSWCPLCKGKVKQSMEAIQLIAQKHGGKCLSKEYTLRKKLTWECAEGHVWEGSLPYIKVGYWCSICRKEERKAAKKLLKDSQKQSD